MSYPLPTTRFHEVLDDIAGQAVDLYCLPGNAGDGLLRMATRQLLDARDIQHTALYSPQHLRNNDTLIVAGHGNFCYFWKDGVELLRAQPERRYRRVIFAPTTVYSPPVTHWLAVAPRYVTFFCREPVSYSIVKATVNRETGPTVLCDHDTALYATLPEELKAVEPAEDLLCAFRTGNDQTVFPECQPNRDISIETADPDYCKHWLEAIANARRIATNRLQVAIGAVLLNREVDFFPNAYFKNRAIYDYSLRHYNRVTWCESSKVKQL